MPQNRLHARAHLWSSLCACGNVVASCKLTTPSDWFACERVASNHSTGSAWLPSTSPGGLPSTDPYPHAASCGVGRDHGDSFGHGHAASARSESAADASSDAFADEFPGGPPGGGGGNGSASSASLPLAGNGSRAGLEDVGSSGGGRGNHVHGRGNRHGHVHGPTCSHEHSGQNGHTRWVHGHVYCSDGHNNNEGDDGSGGGDQLADGAGRDCSALTSGDGQMLLRRAQSATVVGGRNGL
jgi:hypothetical protein